MYFYWIYQGVKLFCSITFSLMKVTCSTHIKIDGLHRKDKKEIKVRWK